MLYTEEVLTVGVSTRALFNLEKEANDKKSLFNFLKICIKNKKDYYVYFLNKLSVKSGRNEMSCASKIIATVNHEKSVIERVVIDNLKINRPIYGDLNYRISMSIDILNETEKDYLKFLSLMHRKDLMNIFNTKTKQQRNFKSTNIKKLDFVLWQTRKLNNKV
jgi:hypothetical protein